MSRTYNSGSDTIKLTMKMDDNWSNYTLQSYSALSEIDDLRPSFIYNQFCSENLLRFEPKNTHTILKCSLMAWHGRSSFVF